MPDYSLGKIYMVYPKVEDPDEGDVYYGSTTVTLARRMAKHRTTKSCSSKLLFDKYGVENCFIELVEEYHCETKEQLNKKEGEYIRNHKCVNKRIEGRTRKEWLYDNKGKITEKKKQYYVENQDNILEKQKQYDNKNKDKIKEYQKEYRIVNRDKSVELNKQNYVKNRDKISELNKQKVSCPHCNKELSKASIQRHIRLVCSRNLPQSVHTTDLESN